MSGLRVPAYEEMDPEQMDVLELPLDGRHLVLGPPGTGKSVMALFRARDYARKAGKSGILVYNVPLRTYLETPAGGGEFPGVGVLSWHSWLAKLCPDPQSKIRSYPHVPPNTYRPDWTRIRTVLQERGQPRSATSVVVDEAQDFPVELLEILTEIRSGMTVFMDYNQRIDDNNDTTPDDVIACLYHDSEPQRPLHVTLNYRNTTRIMALARHWYTGEDGDVLPRCKLDGRKADGPWLWPVSDLHHLAACAAHLYLEQPHQSIGVFVDTKDEVEELYKHLAELAAGEDVFMYHSGLRERPPFGAEGIFVQTLQSCKGLEYDWVVLCATKPRSFSYRTASHVEKNRVFVGITRARKGVAIASTNGALAEFDEIPADVLERRDAPVSPGEQALGSSDGGPPF